MRRFIRHPSSVPIRVEVLNSGSPNRTVETRNVGRGGLCFCSECPLSPGERVRVQIALHQKLFEVEGEVVWCDGEQSGPDKVGCTVGVSFLDENVAYSVRMVEQVCHIEEYRQRQRKLGRELNSEEAAAEWVKSYAASFPK